MNIPEEAIKAATDAVGEYDDYPELYARSALEAAAPFLGLPRTITTVEELDALPMDAVIRDADEYVWERWSLLAKNTNWRCAGAPDLTDDEIALPAVVLWEPGNV